MKPLPTLRTFLQEEGVQGIFIKGDSSIRYFTGFTGGESLLYVDALRAVLITDSRYILQAQQQAPECEILEHQHGLFSVVDQVRPAWRLALDGDYFSYTEATALQKALPKASFKNVNLVFLRAVKSPEEQRKMFKAAAIADDAFHELIPHIKVGRRESELAAELEYNMRKRGAQKPLLIRLLLPACAAPCLMEWPQIRSLRKVTSSLLILVASMTVTAVIYSHGRHGKSGSVGKRKSTRLSLPPMNWGKKSCSWQDGH